MWKEALPKHSLILLPDRLVLVARSSGPSPSVIRSLVSHTRMFLDSSETGEVSGGRPTLSNLTAH